MVIKKNRLLLKAKLIKDGIKKMKKNIKLIIIFAIAVCLFTGCKDSKTTEYSDSTTPATRTITDMADRTVEIPTNINSVATIGSTARMLTYASCADRIVGLSELEISSNPIMPYAYVNSEMFSKLTPVASGGANSETYDEALAMLHPDVIFINYSDINAVNTLQQKLNIPVVVLEYTGIFSESVYDALRLTGDIMGTTEQCTKLITAMKEWQRDLNDRTKDIPDTDKPSVYAGAINFRGAHGIEGTYANYPPFDAINAKNVVDETGEDGALIVEKEKLLVWNPDVIFLTPSNMNLVNDDYRINPNYYSSLKAFKDSNVYTQINYNYFGTNIELSIVDAYYAGTIIYPNAFSDIDFEAKADEIFMEMLGHQYIQVLNNSGNGFGKITLGK